MYHYQPIVKMMNTSSMNIFHIILKQTNSIHSQCGNLIRVKLQTKYRHSQRPTINSRLRSSRTAQMEFLRHDPLHRHLFRAPQQLHYIPQKWYLKSIFTQRTWKNITNTSTIKPSSSRQSTVANSFSLLLGNPENFTANSSKT